MAEHSVPIAVRNEQQQKALIFIHGFCGSPHQTFGMFPAFLAGNPALYDWDIYCFGYATGLAPDVSGIWSSDPDITALAVSFSTAVSVGAFARYAELAVVAHSMGGLVCQRALLDGGFDQRVTGVFLFGVPSAGVRNKASLASWLKKQAKDMVPDGPFITTLRREWRTRYSAGVPFRFLAIAGMSDDFVLGESSQGPFPKTCWRGVAGNHVEMVKPDRAESDNVLLVLQTLTGTGRRAPAAPAVGRSVVGAALDVEMREGTQAALQYLLGQPARDSDTDVMGAIGGRHKRLWLGDPDGHASDGLSALEWYGRGYRRALEAQNHEQVYYHGINVAFLQLALQKDRHLARETAAAVMHACSRASESAWNRATMGEAFLHLGEAKRAVACYEEAIDAGPSSREVGSMYQQAIWVAKFLEDVAAEAALMELFANRS